MTDATQLLSYADPRPRLPMAALVGATLRTFGQAPGAFLVLAAIGAIPAVVNVTLVHSVVGFNRTYMLGALVKALVLCFPQIAITYVAVRCLEGRSYSLGDSLALAARRYVPVLITVVLVLLAYYVGLILLVVPGVIVTLMFAVVLPVCALEGLGPFDSLRRSRELTRDNRWRIFGAYAIFFAPIMVVAFVVAIVAMARRTPTTGQRVNEAIQVVWVPLATIFNAVLYFALRRLKGYDGVAQVFD